MRSFVGFAAALLLSLTVAACAGVASESADAEEEWVALFEGDSLDHWYNPYDWGEAWVEDGVIHLRADQKFFLVTQEQYDDFVLEADVKLPDAESNSGIMIRANVEPNRVYGYQAEVDPTDRAWSGGLYDEGRRGWLNPDRDDEASVQAFREQAGDAFKLDDWNEYRIRAVGDSIYINVNGVQTTAFQDTVDARGHIGIQHHGEDGKIYRFKDIRIKPLS